MSSILSPSVWTPKIMSYSKVKTLSNKYEFVDARSHSEHGWPDLDQKCVNLAPIWTNPRLFSDEIIVHFAQRQNVLKSDLKKSRICPIWGPIWPIFGPNLDTQSLSAAPQVRWAVVCRATRVHWQTVNSRWPRGQRYTASWSIYWPHRRLVSVAWTDRPIASHTQTNRSAYSPVVLLRGLTYKQTFKRVNSRCKSRSRF